MAIIRLLPVNLIFLLFISLTTGIHAQVSSISGIVNSYAKVTSLAGADRLIVDDASFLAQGDTVLVAQMKGASFNGTIQTMNSAGLYEIMVVEDVNQGTGQVVFTAVFKNTGATAYNTNEAVQLVKVAGYSSARVAQGNTLTCKPWDGDTGGILVILVSDTLYVDGAIDVTGKGFRGGDPGAEVHEGGCISESTSGNHPASFKSAGWKGESVLETSYPHLKGRNYAGNGGGGGEGQYMGAGGGAGYADGGNGGLQMCNVNAFQSALGGRVDKIKYVEGTNPQRLLMGGGGGSGTQSAELKGVKGGSGGGVVIILTPHLQSNGGKIQANGGSVTAIAESAGGGGGGGGGMVLLDVDSFSGTISVESKGGNGGKADCNGSAGGSGGGGLVRVKNNAIPESSINVSNGLRGESYTGCTNDAGTVPTAIGDKLSTANLVLNGILFNSVNGAQTICYNTTPGKLTGTMPRGSNPQYTWQRKTETGDWENAPGGTGKDYLAPTSLLESRWYRRQVTTTEGTDISKEILVRVVNEIMGTSISSDQTICSGAQPLGLSGLPSSGGEGTLVYQWQESIDQSTWNNLSGSTNQGYSPGALTASRYYRRITRMTAAPACSVTSNMLTITVLPVIGNNTIGVPGGQTICHGLQPALIAGSQPTGGDSDYRYQWVKSSTATGPWTNASVTSPGFQENPLTQTTHYRRIVLSGLNDVCRDTSSSSRVLVLPLISGNTLLTGTQTVCEASPVNTIEAQQPSGGDGSYIYTWQTRTKLSNWTDQLTLTQNSGYNPGPRSDTLFIRRLVFSGLNNTCKDTSPQTTIQVHPLVGQNTIGTSSGGKDSTLCFGQAPHALKPIFPSPTGGIGTYNFQWQSQVGTGTWADLGQTPSLAPGTLTATTRFRRIVTSGVCQNTSDTISIEVLPLLASNFVEGGDRGVCANTPAMLVGSTPTGGDGIYRFAWQDSIPGGSWASLEVNALAKDYVSPALSAPVSYRRVVLSGLNDCCQLISDRVNIGIFALPSAQLTFLDTTICSDRAIGLRVSPSGNQGPWTITCSDGEGTSGQSITNGPGIITLTPSSALAEVSRIFRIISVIDSEGCEAPESARSGEARVKIHGNPVAQPGQDTEVCGLSGTLVATPSLGTGAWKLPAGMQSTGALSSPTIPCTVDNQGVYTIQWKETNWQCKDSSTVKITFWKETSQADAGEDIELEPFLDRGLLKANEQGLVGIGTWSRVSGNGNIESPSQSETSVSGLSKGENLFRWTVQNGVCPSTFDEVKILVTDELFRPNAFSPNNDGLNDFFRIKGVGNAANEFTVYNRWGTEVYQEENFMKDKDSPGWDGKDNKGKVLPNDTYYYILRVKEVFPQTLQGIIIIRGAVQ